MVAGRLSVDLKLLTTEALENSEDLLHQRESEEEKRAKWFSSGRKEIHLSSAIEFSGIVHYKKHHQVLIHRRKMTRIDKEYKKGDHEEDEDAFYKHMKEQYLKKIQAKEDQDRDYLFMVSLVPELKKVPQDCILKVKSSIINLLINAQQYHSRPSTNPGPSFAQPSVPTSQEFMAPTVMEDMSRYSIRLDPAKGGKHGQESAHQPQGQGEEHFTPAASVRSDDSLFSTE
ncbi:hypothetical protein PR048_020327 [Dryococelus australis]|uniref:BESS domain-containing protein n=1 Tax=Dryococelus australis TaxID=614101 RepID=A0ABQ9H608_9NEOP|nr:hypothetical protein PR048_020327 [Dryococelus australis]